MDEHTLTWWQILCAVAVVNVALWVVSALAWHRTGAVPDDQVRRCGRWQLALSAGYVAGCAFRSFFPVFDVPRQVLFDGWWSSVLVGRSVATVAELCFATQWAVLLGSAAARNDDRLALAVSRVLVPMIALAELCSWYSVVTTSNLGHVIEESLWGLGAALVVAGVARWRGLAARLIVVAGCVYVAYMFAMDVPMYWHRWLADEASGRSYLSLAQGLADLSARWVVSHRWQDWRSEVLWMSLYFSVAVWVSIALVHVPEAVRGLRQSLGRPQRG